MGGSKQELEAGETGRAGWVVGSRPLYRGKTGDGHESSPNIGPPAVPTPLNITEDQEDQVTPEQEVLVAPQALSGPWWESRVKHL